MKFTSAIIASIFSASALAAPSPMPDEKSMMAAVPQWTIQNMQRTCNSGDTECVWTFGINTHVSTVTPCTFKVTGTKASQALNAGPGTCGAYTVTSGWSGQFGPGNGFTTLSVIDYNKKLIVWPAYTDKQLVNGQVVSPDQSYAPATLG